MSIYRLKEKKHVEARPLVILEGIFALYEERFRKLMDLKIFVYADDEVRLARRISRDINEYKVNRDYAKDSTGMMSFYNKFV